MPKQPAIPGLRDVMKKKVTRRELFLSEMDSVVPWTRLLALIEPHYPKVGPKGGRPPMPLERMLRVYFLQSWYALSDPIAEESPYDSEAMRRFAGIELGDDRIPDETTILNFRHLLEKHQLTEKLFAEVNAYLADKGVTLRSGTLVEPCIAFDDVEPPRKGMAVTRSAGTPMTDFDTLFQAITAHATRAAEKLRQHGLVAGTLTVFFHTNRHRPDRPQYAGSRSTRLTPMTSDTFELVAAAKQCAVAAWPKTHTQNYAFTKAGVMLDDLLPQKDQPRTLFDEPRKSPTLMAALDAVNARLGKKTMVLASEGTARSWKLRANHRSPRYTTRISDLPVVG